VSGDQRPGPPIVLPGRPATSKYLTAAEIAAALEVNIAAGYIAPAGVDADGEPLYRLTPAGVARVKQLLAESDDN
jgi:hypothetical protein